MIYLNLLDLTSLSDIDTEITIATLCQKAITPDGHVAAVCVFPRFVKQVADYFSQSPVRIATVVNFPHGTDSIEQVISTMSQAIHAGAHEIDLVFPYTRYLAGETQEAFDFIHTCKKALPQKIILKVILETGMLRSPDKIAHVSENVLLAGADFLKTSTGKVAIGATIEAAEIMLKAIKHYSAETGRQVGFKASGGIRTVEQAEQYIQLANHIMGAGWATSATFRLGTSQLLT